MLPRISVFWNAKCTRWSYILAEQWDDVFRRRAGIVFENRMKDKGKCLACLFTIEFSGENQCTELHTHLCLWHISLSSCSICLKPAKFLNSTWIITVLFSHDRRLFIRTSCIEIPPKKKKNTVVDSWLCW